MIEKGTQEELLEKQGAYADMYELQKALEQYRERQYNEEEKWNQNRHAVDRTCKTDVADYDRGSHSWSDWVSLCNIYYRSLGGYGLLGVLGVQTKMSLHTVFIVVAALAGSSRSQLRYGEQAG